MRGVVNLPVGETTALRLVGYYNELAGFIDSYYPGRSVREDVNSGEKYGARVSMLFQPSDTLSITPRIVYQKLETDGYPRIDCLQHPRQPVHDDAAGGRSRASAARSRRSAEGIDDEFLLADLDDRTSALGELTLTSVSSYTDRDVVVVRDAVAAHRQRVISLGGPFPPAATPAEVRLNSPLIDTTTLEDRSARRCASPPTAATRSSGWSARSTRTSTANTARTCRLRATTHS